MADIGGCGPTILRSSAPDGPVCGVAQQIRLSKVRIPSSFVKEHLPELQQLSAGRSCSITLQVVLLPPRASDITPETPAISTEEVTEGITVRRNAGGGTSKSPVFTVTGLAAACPKLFHEGYWCRGFRKLDELHLQMLCSSELPPNIKDAKQAMTAQQKATRQLNQSQQQSSASQGQQQQQEDDADLPTDQGDGFMQPEDGTVAGAAADSGRWGSGTGRGLLKHQQQQPTGRGLPVAGLDDGLASARSSGSVFEHQMDVEEGALGSKRSAAAAGVDHFLQPPAAKRMALGCEGDMIAAAVTEEMLLDGGAGYDPDRSNTQGGAAGAEPAQILPPELYAVSSRTYRSRDPRLQQHQQQLEQQDVPAPPPPSSPPPPPPPPPPQPLAEQQLLRFQGSVEQGGDHDTQLQQQAASANASWQQQQHMQQKHHTGPLKLGGQHHPQPSIGRDSQPQQGWWDRDRTGPGPVPVWDEKNKWPAGRQQDEKQERNWDRGSDRPRQGPREWPYPQDRGGDRSRDRAGPDPLPSWDEKRGRDWDRGSNRVRQGLREWPHQQDYDCYIHDGPDWRERALQVRDGQQRVGPAAVTGRSASPRRGSSRGVDRSSREHLGHVGRGRSPERGGYQHPRTGHSPQRSSSPSRRPAAAVAAAAGRSLSPVRGTGRWGGQPGAGPQQVKRELSPGRQVAHSLASGHADRVRPRHGSPDRSRQRQRSPEKPDTHRSQGSASRQQGHSNTNSKHEMSQAEQVRMLESFSTAELAQLVVELNAANKKWHNRPACRFWSGYNASCRGDCPVPHMHVLGRPSPCYLDRAAVYRKHGFKPDKLGCFHVYISSIKQLLERRNLQAASNKPAAPAAAAAAVAAAPEEPADGSQHTQHAAAQAAQQGAAEDSSAVQVPAAPAGLAAPIWSQQGCIRLQYRDWQACVPGIQLQPNVAQPMCVQFAEQQQGQQLQAVVGPALVEATLAADGGVRLTGDALKPILQQLHGCIITNIATAASSCSSSSTVHNICVTIKWPLAARGRSAGQASAAPGQQILVKHEELQQLSARKEVEVEPLQQRSAPQAQQPWQQQQQQQDTLQLHTSGSCNIEAPHVQLAPQQAAATAAAGDTYAAHGGTWTRMAEAAQAAAAANTAAALTAGGATPGPADTAATGSTTSAAGGDAGGRFAAPAPEAAVQQFVPVTEEPWRLAGSRAATNAADTGAHAAAAAAVAAATAAADGGGTCLNQLPLLPDAPATELPDAVVDAVMDLVNYLHKEYDPFLDVLSCAEALRDIQDDDKATRRFMRVGYLALTSAVRMGNATGAADVVRRYLQKPTT